MLLDTKGLNHRSFFLKHSNSFSFYISKRNTSVSSSLNRQAWTITISTEKRNQTKKKYWLSPIFEWVAINLFAPSPLQNILCTNRIKMSTEVSQMHKYVTCSTLYFLFCFFSPGLQSWASCARASLFVSRRTCGFYPQCSAPLPPCCASIGRSRMNHRMVV